MANPQGRIEKRRDSGRRAKASRASGLRPAVEGLEGRRLLTVAINEFGGHAAVNMTAGITTGPDGNLWATEADPFGGAIDRVTPSGAIQRYTTGLSAGAVPTGITTGPDGALWFTEYGSSSLSPFLSGASAIGRIDPATGQITEFSAGITPASGPTQIVVGSDKALWFTEKVGNKIGRIDPANGRITEFTTGLTANSQPVGITAAPDGALWFAESNTDRIGRITTAGAITEFGAGVITPNSAPTGITVGPDGNLWFTEIGSASNPAGGLGRITLQGAITQYTAGLTPASGPAGITSGPNGSLYFTEQNSGLIGEITIQGAITEFNQNTKTSGPAAITLGPDGNLWFTELAGTHVDRITPVGVLTQFPKADALPGGSSPTGITGGPDGALWFTEPGVKAIGRIDSSGAITQFTSGITSTPLEITQGPDNALWFTESGGLIGRITTLGVVTEFLTSPPAPAIAITKATNGQVATSPPGPTLAVGSTVTWTYTVTDPGTDPLRNLVLVDDAGTPGVPGDDFQPAPVLSGTFNIGDSNRNGLLDPGESFRYTATGTVGLGPYQNRVTVTAAGNLSNTPVNAATTSNYVGAPPAPAISIFKLTNGQFTNPPGPTLAVGSTVTWTYEVSDPGTDPLRNLVLVDDAGTPGVPGDDFQPAPVLSGTFNIGDSNRNGLLDPGESFRYTATGTVGLGPYQNRVTVTAAGNLSNTPVNAATTSNYVGAPPAPAIAITKATNGQVATSPPGPTLAVGSTVTWTYTVTDPGTDPLRNLVLVDDAGTPGVPGDDFQPAPVLSGTFNIGDSNRNGLLDPGETFQYTATGTVGLGPYQNRVTVTAAGNLSNTPVNAATTSNYVGAPPAPAISIFKLTNGQFTNPPGPTLAVGSTVTWTYEVSDPGTDPLRNLVLVDDAGTPGVPGDDFQPAPVLSGTFNIGDSNRNGLLDPGESFRYTATGTVGLGPYQNRVTVTAAGNLSNTPVNAATTGNYVGSSSRVNTPNDITLGPDGNLWFTIGLAVGRITPQGVVTKFSAGIAPGGIANGITTGSDGNLWFTVDRSINGTSTVDRITTAGVITEFAISTSNAGPTDIAPGPGGDLFFTEEVAGQIGRITTAGSITELSPGGPGSLNQPDGIVTGPDNLIYFVEFAGNTLDRLNADGSFTRIPIPTGNSNPRTVAVGSDKNLWFTEASASQIGQAILPQSSVTASGVPTLNLAAGQSFNLVLTTFTDASPAASAANFAATIDYGDGTQPTSAVVTPVSSGGFSISGSHVYAAGQYTISVTIANAAGQAAPVRSLANVTGVAVPSFVVTNTNDAGPGSLRQAIQNADNTTGATITFAIPASFTNPATGVATIAPLSALPMITSRTVIDGTTQASFAGKPTSTILVQVSGVRTANSNGLVFAQTSASSVLAGISIFGFAGNQVVLDGDGEDVRGCSIGLAVGTTSGSVSAGAVVVPPAPAPAPASRAGAAGLLVQGANEVIGGLTPADRNVISNNGYHGILFTGPRATGGLVLGNYIGTNPAGTAAAPNVGDGIVAIDGAMGLTICSNLISGNGGNGIEFYGSSANLVITNLIGTDITGTRRLSNLGSGICVDVGSSHNTIGGATPGSGNVLSGNGVTGLAIQTASSGNVVAYNRVGTNIAGAEALGNGNAGILVLDSADNTIGPGNLVSGNGTAKAGAGIWIDGTDSTRNHVFANHVGTDLDGELAIPNAIVGLVVSNASGNTIGGPLGEGNLISGNASIGLEIAGNQPPGTVAPASGNVVQGNVIGLDAGGLRAIGNGSSQSGVGLYVLNASGNTIGGPSLALGNVISGNNFDGVELFGPGTSGNVLQFNRIGTNGPGTGPCGNAVDGLTFDGTSANTATSNYIAANGRNGVFIAGSSGVVLQLNQIGLGVGGQALGNGTFGILMGNSSTGTVKIGNLNVNNVLGPERDTDISPARSSSTVTNPGVTGHGSTNSAGVKTSSKARHPVKVQPASKSFGGRQVARTASPSKSRPKH